MYPDYLCEQSVNQLVCEPAKHATPAWLCQYMSMLSIYT
jgi:hypothetical protein